MGNFIPSGLRGNQGVQEVAIQGDRAYKWPPKSGNYFGSYFIMGGERFDAPQPESFLFGENSDLNFLGSHPKPFPYPPPQLTEPTRALKSLVNIRKDSVRLVRVDSTEDHCHGEGDGAGLGTGAADTLGATAGEGGDVEPTDENKGSGSQENALYNLEFVFDSDAACHITVHYFGVEEMEDRVLSIKSNKMALSSAPFHYSKGLKQTFSQPSHTLQPDMFPEEQWHYDSDEREIPIIIHCAVDDKEGEHSGHSHLTLATLEKGAEGYSVKVIKQKQVVDGMVYILQEFYGVENKENEGAKSEDDLDDNGSECVICMSDIRNTLILPCRHMCLCNNCADNLRYQASCCPICRSPFRALLQIRAIRRKSSRGRDQAAVQGSDDDDDLMVSQKGVPSGYEAISLMEALNGPHKIAPGSARTSQRFSSNVSLRRQSSKSKKKHKDDKLKKEKEKGSKKESEKKDSKLAKERSPMRDVPEGDNSVQGVTKEPASGGEVDASDGERKGSVMAEDGVVLTDLTQDPQDSPGKEEGAASTHDSVTVVNEKDAAFQDVTAANAEEEQSPGSKRAQNSLLATMIEETGDEDSSACDEERQFLKPEEQDNSSNATSSP